MGAFPLRTTCATFTSLLALALAPGAGADILSSPFGARADGSSHPGVRASAVSPQARDAVLEQATGLPASELTAVNACSAEPAKPACAAKTIVTRNGHRPVHPQVQRSKAPQVRASSAFGFPSAGAAPPAQPAPTPFTPAYLQQAYDLTYLSATKGVGKTVAIVDVGDYANAEQDLAVFRSTYGLPACTTANGCFTKVNDQGQPSPLPAPNAQWEGETMLDLDAVSAICPNCKILLVETAGYMERAVKTAATWPGVTQVSNSWVYEVPALSGTYTYPGVSIVAATGDWGSYEGGQTQAFPAALPGVVAVGGTTLAPSGGGAGGRGFSESAWAWSSAAAGSGCATNQTKPSYQKDTGCTGRAYSDVSAEGDPNTGLKIYDSGGGGWRLYGGTSLATPLVAAYEAIAGISDATPQWPYANSALLNDPVGGTVFGSRFSPGACPASIAYICTAGVGYDGPTGIGSISGALVTGAPGIGWPTVGSSTQTYTKQTTQSTATLIAGIYPNGLDTTYYWQYGPTTSYGAQTQPVGIGAGTTPVATSDTLTGLNSTTTYHYRLIATNALGTSYGSDYTATTTAVGPQNTAPPAIAGTARQGQLLSASTGAWTGTGITYSYQWQRSSDKSTWSNIASTAASYVPGVGDVNMYLRVAVTAANAGGSASASSTAVGPVASGAPAGTASIAGTAKQGRVLTVQTSFNPTPSSTTYLWERKAPAASSWTVITGATGPSYTLTTADEGLLVTCAVSASNAYGTLTLTPTAVGPVAADPPVNTAAPLLSGTTQRTTTLSVTQGTWQGTGNVYSYQWQRSADGQAWTSIAGATGTSYTLTTADEGQYIRALVSASNPDAIVDQPSNRTSTIIAPYPPANLIPPTVSGAASRTSTLAADRGTWSGPNLVYTYRWQRDAGNGYMDIPGATSGTYTLTAADEGYVVRVVVTATNEDGAFDETSDPTDVVKGALPVNSVPPSISGTAQRSSTLTGTQGTWGGIANTYAVQWQHSTDNGLTWSDVAGATTLSYLVGVSDEGSMLRLKVTAGNADGTATATSTPTAVVLASPPSYSVAPTIAGTAQRSSTLTASPGTWNGIGNSYSYQWQRSPDGSTWTSITGATSTAYTLTVADENTKLRFRVTATNPDGTLVALSATTQSVAAAPAVNTAKPTVTGTAQRASVLTATQGAWSGIGNAYAYQWQRSTSGQTWTNITGATDTSYALAVLDEGAMVRVQVTATNPDGTATATSAATATVLAAPPTVSAVPTLSGTVQRASTLTGTQGTWGGIGNTYAQQWQRSGDNGATWTNISGQTDLTYTLTRADENTKVRLLVTASNPDGTVSAGSAPTVTVPASPPTNTAPPAVNGVAKRGNPLGSDPGSWGGLGNTYTLQWQRSADGQTWTDIAGATGDAYTLTVADENAKVRLRVTASNPDGTLAVASAPSGTVQAVPPTNTVGPTMSGSAHRGQALGVSGGTWSNVDTIAYQWQRSAGGTGPWTNITGATKTLYTLTVADENATVRAVVTGANVDGSLALATAASALIPSEPPTNSVPPTVTGTAQRGSWLQAMQGTWGGLGNTYTYQWQRSTDGSAWTDIAGATADHYGLAVADEGFKLRVLVTATNPDAAVAVASAPTAVVQATPPANSVAPVLGGIAQRRQIMYATDGTWSGVGNTYSYQWQHSFDGGRTWTACPSQVNTSAYNVVSSDVGGKLRLVVTATNPDGSLTVATAPSAIVAAWPPKLFTSVVMTSNSMARGGVVSVSDPGFWDGPDNSYTYQWQRSSNGATWTNVSGATSVMYTLTQADEGYYFRVAVTATNPDASVTAYSGMMGPASAAPPYNTARPTVSGALQRGNTLTGTQGTWWGPDNTYAYQWQRSADGQTWTSIAGATDLAYLLGGADSNMHLRLVVTATNMDAPNGVSAASLATAAVVPQPPVNTKAPFITGSAFVGKVLVADAGAWNPGGTYGYQWQRSSGSGYQDIAGATGSAYTAGSADIGRAIRVSVTAANSDGAVTAQSQPTASVLGAPKGATAPKAPAGTLQDSYTLIADPGTWDQTGLTYTYRWMRCPASATSGVDQGCSQQGTGATHVIDPSDVGFKYAVNVTASGPGGATAAIGALTGVITARPFYNTAPPSISGTAQVPNTLTANPGTWNLPTTDLALSWKRCDADGQSNCAQVSTASTYTLQAADAAHTIVLYATANASAGQTATAHSPALLIAAQPLPQPTVAPTVTGTAKRTFTLTADRGSWSNHPTSVQGVWQRCDAQGTGCTDVPGSSGWTTYTLTRADEGFSYTVKVTASNTSGTVTATAKPTAPVAAYPAVSTHAPVIAGTSYNQDAQIGIATNSATWTAPPDTTYQTSWLRCAGAGQGCAAIAGATGALYTLTAADVGHTLKAVITAANPDGTVTASSAPTPVILAPAPRWKTLPLISSDPGYVGDVLTMTAGTWTGPVVSSDVLEMMRCTISCAPAALAGGTSYTIDDADLGAILRVRETASNSGGTTVVWSARYVGPVLSQAAGAAVLKASTAISVKNTKGQTLATAQLQQAIQANAVRAGAAKATPAAVTVTRAARIAGKLSTWVCTVPSARTLQSCSAKVRIKGRSATVKLTARMTGKLRVVVVRR